MSDDCGWAIVFIGAAVFALAAALPGASALAGQEATLQRVPFHVLNRTGGPIACEAALAHWYAAEVGVAAAGVSVDAELWSDPASGTVYLMNARGEPMPVQALWCGLAGAAASTGADVALARRAGAREPAVELTCAGVRPDGRLLCTRR